MRSEEILNNPLFNKGTAFTLEEREVLGLHGLLPYHVSTIEQQVERRYQNFCDQTNELSKHVFLTDLQNRNEVLFYRLVFQHIDEMLPLIYTPTVGDASRHYSSLYREHRGIYLSYPLKEKIPDIIANISKDEIDVIVVTDGERILGLGDLGIGGMAIPVGKLALYTLFGGIHPAKALPVLLDVGTNNKELLNDPLYIGWRHERISGKEYDDFIDLFIKSIKKRYPRVLLQWEDFAKPHAKPLLNRYRKEICSFNDDIQGTAAVVLSTIFTTMQLKQETLKEQTIVVLGGGSAGIGICHMIAQAMMDEGLSQEEARKRFFIVDKDGLIHSHLKCDEEQKAFAQNVKDLTSWKLSNPPHISLLDVIHNTKPTVLIGVSAQRGAFTKEIVKAMAEKVERPLILPLSNPTSLAEADPNDLIEWTEGEALVATGSPFPGFSQCNNVYIYPGLGLGVIASKATYVSDALFFTAAKVLSAYAPILRDDEGSLFPAFESLRTVSRAIAMAVGEKAQEEGFAPRISSREFQEIVEKTMWYPNYEKIT